VKRSILSEILIILAVSIVLGFTVNFISPNGVALVEDYSERFKIDETAIGEGNEDVKPEREYTKEGFVKPQNISTETAKNLFDKKVLFIDGREAEEFKTGHIQGAINIPYKEFDAMSREEKLERTKDLDMEATIVCYCGGGDCEISIDLAYEMAKIGFNELKIYLGGYLEWTAAGYPTEKSE
jgi:rhodanese-related sulfurtransferase